MALKDILSGKNDESREYLWALVIEPGWVQAGVWRIHEDKTQIVSSSPATAWELEEDLVSAVDTALSASIQSIPEEAGEPSKAVFGVISSWVSNGEIKEEYLDKIKQICSKLSLIPVGFVVLPEAIAHFIKSDEGSPLSACIIGIAKEEIEISVFKLGKLAGSSKVARSLSVFEDVVEGLTRFSGTEPLPSRFIIYDGKEGEIEEVRQSLLKAGWEDIPSVKFLHTPKIETFSPKKKIDAVSLAGASELADVTSILPLEPEESKEKSEENVENIVSTDEQITAEELGFAVGQDITKVQGSETEEVLEEEKPIQEEKEPRQVKEERLPKKPVFKLPDREKIIAMFTRVKNMIPVGLKSLGKRKSTGQVSKKTFSAGLVFFVLVIIGIFVAWWFYPKATVTIYLSTKALEERVDFTIDTALGEPNISEKSLPGEVLSTSISGEKTKSTTGTKTVGERAKGEITLFRVGSQINVAAGSAVIGPNNLEFTLDDDVTIASGSAGTPGTVKAAITAGDIGAQYNLTGSTNFQILGYSTSDIEGKNENSFSGGSSREISAVSSEDQDTLENDLTGELSDKAIDEFKDELSADVLFIDESISATPSAVSFSNKVGDEASTLKLSLTIDTNAVSVRKEYLFDLANDVLKDKIPDGFVLRSEQVDLDFEFVGQQNGVYEMSARVSANLLPEIDTGEVTDKIIGKYPKVVENYLRSEISGFSRAEITFNKPRFPGRLGTLPRVLKHLDVEVAAAK